MCRNIASAFTLFHAQQFCQTNRRLLNNETVVVLLVTPANMHIHAASTQCCLPCAGILIVDSAQLMKAEKAKLGSALEQGWVEPTPAGQVPATAAVWLFTSAETLSKGKAHSSLANGSTGSCQEIVQDAERELGLGLVKAFDLLHFCNLGPELQHDSAQSTAAIRGTMPSSILQRPATTAAARFRHTGATQSTAGNATTLQHALMHRVSASASMQPPTVTEEAMTMIQEYYAFIRQNIGQASSCRDVGPHTVVSLLRMASACARLHARHDVLPMPDVVLAVFLLQESLKAQVRRLSGSLHVVVDICINSIRMPCLYRKDSQRSNAHACESHCAAEDCICNAPDQSMWVKTFAVWNHFVWYAADWFNAKVVMCRVLIHWLL